MAMDCGIYGVVIKLRMFFILFLSLSTFTSTLSSSSSNVQINSNSILVALLDSHYTKIAELVEKAMLLQTLEDTVGNNNITIFAPKNEALEQDLDPNFKTFLLEPRNLKSLQSLLTSHIIPTRINGSEPGSTRHKKHRLPSAYNRFMKEEIQRIKAANPQIPHRSAPYLQDTTTSPKPQSASLCLQ